jgi:hypothetical protein
MKNKEKVRARVTVAPHTAQLTAIGRGKVLMKVEKALNFRVEDTNRKRVKVQQSRERPGVAQRVPGDLGSKIFMTFGT